MSPTEAAVEHLRLQREFQAARDAGDNQRIPARPRRAPETG